MDLVARNRNKNVYIYVKRGNPESARVVVDENGRYRCDDVLCIPVPKRFALLEPDAEYFELTLKANVCLALRGVREKDLHQ
ncbi:MAG: hypothetical protein ABWW66_03415 [Archaeoglobaceae archaeon]